MSEVEFRVGDDWANVVAEILAEAAGRGDEIALTGGSTPASAYERAAQLRPDWSGAGVWWSDERCVEPSDQQSNYKLAHDSLLARLHHAPRVHRIRGELQRDAAAAEYEQEVRERTIALLLLGIGPDGHVASLFPHALSLEERERSVIGVPAGFEPYVDRVTFTLPRLNASPFVVFLVTGDDKAAAVRAAFADAPGPQTPSSLVRGTERTLVVLDRAAAAQLDL